MRPSDTPARGLASARLARGSLGGSAAASSAAAAAPPWVGAGGGAWLARGAIGWAAARARAIVVGRLAACAWRATQVGSGEPCALTGRFPGACEWWPAECKPRGRGVAVCGWSASSHAR